MQSSKNEPFWISKKQACEYLMIGIRTIEYWVADGTINAYKLGGRIYFDRNELDAAIKGGARWKR